MLLIFQGMNLNGMPNNFCYKKILVRKLFMREINCKKEVEKVKGNIKVKDYKMKENNTEKTKETN